LTQEYLNLTSLLLDKWHQEGLKLMF